MAYTMGSLFAGIGGFDLGFERAGFKTLWQVEIDPYCQKVLAKNFPEAERFGDIRECGRHNLKPVDVICGGFPCQDISNAGKRAGIEGERSGLWSEYARIICELRPRYVLVENVAALLGRGMGTVLGDLSEIGYDAEWKIISAADVGAPHLRERVWIMGYPGSAASKRNTRGILGAEEEECGPREFDGDLPVGLSDASEGSRGRMVADDKGVRCGTWREGRSNPSREGQSEQPLSILDTAHDSENGNGIRRGNAFGQWRVEPSVGRVAHGVPKRVDRLRGLGNSVVPQIPEMIARRIKQALEAA